ncbi:hypothetical protein C8R47DRAFT_1074639 [Mycena vitilis]|nr:hypothetical protein C8R47DRAFT_1074639 [Mycena vitilis]
MGRELAGFDTSVSHETAGQMSETGLHLPTQRETHPTEQTFLGQPKRQPLLKTTHTQLNKGHTGGLKTSAAPEKTSQENGVGNFWYPLNRALPLFAATTTANSVSEQNEYDPSASDAKSPEECPEWKKDNKLTLNTIRHCSLEATKAPLRWYRRLVETTRRGAGKLGEFFRKKKPSLAIQNESLIATITADYLNTQKETHLAGFRIINKAPSLDPQAPITEGALLRRSWTCDLTAGKSAQSDRGAEKDTRKGKGPTKNTHGSVLRERMTRYSEKESLVAAENQPDLSPIPGAVSRLVRHDARGVEYSNGNRRRHGMFRVGREVPILTTKIAGVGRMVKTRGKTDQEWRDVCAAVICCATIWAVLVSAAQVAQKPCPNQESTGRGRPFTNKGCARADYAPDRAFWNSTQPPPTNTCSSHPLSHPNPVSKFPHMPTYYRDWSSMSPPQSFERNNPFSGNQHQQPAEAETREPAEGRSSFRHARRPRPAPSLPIPCGVLSRARTHHFGAIDHQPRGGTAHQRVQAAVNLQWGRHRDGQLPIVRPGSVVAPHALYTGREVRPNGQEVHHTILLNARLLVHNPVTGAPGMCNGHAMVHFYAAPTTDHTWDLETPFPTAEQVRSELPMYGDSVHREVGLQRRDGNFEIDISRQVHPIRSPTPAGRALTPIIHAPRPTRPGVPSFLRDAHVHRPAIGRPTTSLVLNDRGTQLTPPEPFQYISFPSGTPPRFLTPNALPTELRDESTGYEVLAIPTRHHPTLPAWPRPDTPGLPTILHEGRPVHLTAPTPANSQVNDVPGVAARAHDAWVRESRLRVRAVTNQFWEQRHFEELRRQLARTTEPTRAVAKSSRTRPPRTTEARTRKELQMTSPSRSNSNTSAVDEEAAGGNEEAAEEDTQEVDGTQKVRDWLMDDSLSDEEAMRELDSTSEESDEEAEIGFFQRHNRGAMKAKGEQRGRNRERWEYSGARDRSARSLATFTDGSLSFYPACAAEK